MLGWRVRCVCGLKGAAGKGKCFFVTFVVVRRVLSALMPKHVIINNNNTNARTDHAQRT